MDCAPNTTVFKPEPQTLLTVNDGVANGRPALRATWWAGFWPRPACSTLPRITSSMCRSSGNSARLAATVATPSSTADVLASAPANLPMAVRLALTITTELFIGQPRLPQRAKGGGDDKGGFGFGAQLLKRDLGMDLIQKHLLVTEAK